MLTVTAAVASGAPESGGTHGERGLRVGGGRTGRAGLSAPPAGRAPVTGGRRRAGALLA